MKEKGIVMGVVLNDTLGNWIKEKSVEWNMTQSEVIRRCIHQAITNQATSNIPKNYETKGE